MPTRHPYIVWTMSSGNDSNFTTSLRISQIPESCNDVLQWYVVKQVQTLLGFRVLQMLSMWCRRGFPPWLVTVTNHHTSWSRLNIKHTDVDSEAIFIPEDIVFSINHFLFSLPDCVLWLSMNPSWGLLIVCYGIKEHNSISSQVF